MAAVSSAAPPSAWVTLLSQPSYLPGVRTLHRSLTRVGTARRLAVMVTDAIDASGRQALADAGCLVREVEPVRPESGRPTSYADIRFAEVWTKLAAWTLTEFERVVYLDADMLVVQPMDELFDIALPEDTIAACHACRCNPNRITSYPAGWRPENCFYSHCRDLTHTEEAGRVDNYLNGGLLVLRPDAAVFDDMMSVLARLDDLSPYPFAEQDFLNEYFQRRWRPLPYVYNALKTLPFQHPALWDQARVKNIHYIIDKPWQTTPDPTDRYHALDTLWRDVSDGVDRRDPPAVPGANQCLPSPP